MISLLHCAAQVRKIIFGDAVNFQRVCFGFDIAFFTHIDVQCFILIANRICVVFIKTSFNGLQFCFPIDKLIVCPQYECLTWIGHTSDVNLTSRGCYYFIIAFGIRICNRYAIKVSCRIFCNILFLIKKHIVVICIYHFQLIDRCIQTRLNTKRHSVYLKRNRFRKKALCCKTPSSRDCCLSILS